MTKQIRIENADTSDHKVTVEVWDTTAEGPMLVGTHKLDYPTSMLNTTIWNNRYVIIKESNGS